MRVMGFSKRQARRGRTPKKKSVAEGVGFEPTVPCGTLVFKTSAFDHSATPPVCSGVNLHTPPAWIQ